jgi:imidazole glycerol-phosphate synthase subunit HisH
MIAIIKYNAGNIKSVQNALTRLGFESIITDDPMVLMNADKVIFPGVGEASTAMKYLRDRELDKTIRSLTQPVLGICLGLQLMCRFSEEANTECLGIFDSDVRLFPPVDKIPHMGWNNFLTIRGELFKDISLTDDVYYVHSYYAEISPYTSATCDYILPFSAAMNRDNFYATQFHPEKSAEIGEKILRNFLAI